MDERLFEASRKGNTATLLQLLEEDPLILEDNSKHASVETPLHIASLHGHTDFVSNILRQKPGFAKVVNSKGYSPLHVACANGHVEIVKELLKVDGESDHELCRRKDKKGRTPMHLAVIRGRDRVVASLILACPESVREVTDIGETILHLTVKSENGCKMLRGLLEGFKYKEMLNWKDEEGNTVLHLAAVRKQHEVIKLLLLQPELDVNAVNSNKLKALDILLKGPKQSNDQEIVEMLHLASTPKADNQELPEQSQADETVIDVDTKGKDSTSKMDTASSLEWLGELRSGLMVMAVLIATVTFEVALNPPGGLWQDGVPAGSNITRLMNSHRPGKAIAGETSPNSLTWFMVWDSIGFLASMSIIVVLTSPSKLKGNTTRWKYIRLMMWVVIASVHMVFLYGVQITTASNIFKRAVIAPFVFFYGVVGLLALRSGWSLLTEWCDLFKELWTKKNR
ncbi:PREDICTED: serine/threonine-protein phosphatase 6 regulatory ankyrin repeat subunit B [Theobroma cacao]|uniref:Serine/threonine-protein phosphatase 6 regulatory ankyrin repeat subunit B n=1 Tax=Theobroma cacao TaxID=3641 RepID=A0AB32WWR4_THECC|nr:PREDICTED: serine/threonine-protein phosphatase 6 regulatory ankyrin repeat subunit B [Theobroma cacao]